VRRQIELSNDVAAELAGSGDTVLREIEQHVDCDVYLRGNVVTLDGDQAAVDQAADVVREIADLVAGGHEISPGTINAVTGALDSGTSPASVLEDVVWTHRSTKVAPKSVNQKRYVDSIRRNTITFGIGPAGTGKTWLAVASAAAALSRREVNRIILTRPAVEAGERLGFLPGDLMAKIDPYLRPLFDALADMLDPEKVQGHLERGTIEVAPLAFMRGRAQPVDRPVLTPEGFRPIGSLRVGDLVVGSDGLPTPVLGVYPQGRKEVFRVATQDGASTLACGEHLWAVKTPEDRRRGKPARVLETREMIGRLGQAHQHRYELPVVAPVELPEQDVPLDPYALGLGLADVAAAPFALAPAGNAATVGGPVAVVPRAEGLGEAPSGEASIPREYLHNSRGVRLAVLQGLLDAAGAPVRTEDGAAVRVRLSAPELRSDTTWLVRSLGGVADEHPDALLDIHLPSGAAPFRDERKLWAYEEDGGGRPMRFITSIEPAGEAECVCISVAAEDSLYVTDDFLVTHNTLNDSFVILDEAQNTSPEQMKMFLTRLGFGSKMVITGDVTQVDLPRDQQSGLIVVSEILRDVEGIEFVRFGREDVVRHRLVQRIVDAYAEAAQQSATELRRKRA
jgi:phosphate starvation-inducible PhoH-like protein